MSLQIKKHLVFNNGDTEPSAECADIEVQESHVVFWIGNQKAQTQVLVKIVKGEVVDG